MAKSLMRTTHSARRARQASLLLLETQYAQRAPMEKFQALGHQSAKSAKMAKPLMRTIHSARHAKQANLPSLETQHAQRAPMEKFPSLGHQSANYAAPEKYPTGIIQCVKFAKQASLRQMKVWSLAKNVDLGNLPTFPGQENARVVPRASNLCRFTEALDASSVPQESLPLKEVIHAVRVYLVRFQEPELLDVLHVAPGKHPYARHRLALNVQGENTRQMTVICGLIAVRVQ